MCELERSERKCVRGLYSVKYIEIESERMKNKKREDSLLKYFLLSCVLLRIWKWRSVVYEVG